MTSEFTYLDYKNLSPGEASPFKSMTKVRPNIKQAFIEFSEGGEVLDAVAKKGK